jgi:hypothetical protein
MVRQGICRQNINDHMKGAISDFWHDQGNKMIRNHDVHGAGKLT